MRMLHSSFILFLVLFCSAAATAQDQPSIRLVAAASTSAATPASLVSVVTGTAPALRAGADASGFLDGTVWTDVARRHGLDLITYHILANCRSVDVEVIEDHGKRQTIG
ncbi:hypothetical protein [Thiocystis violascens]|uniref:Uncharacterized protein n=1 Tax=Thiocystis violascens (strain ATCC 17096 / DSM 198 / 6111) TaxID=765911 RepID=I3Y8Y2_THIV6|nr:hypothetical protein [Thiocystis violascens]AFL73450.1 hypothetical protein Thivi_1444 [Thiocystis violascens DSM 198]